MTLMMFIQRDMARSGPSGELRSIMARRIRSGKVRPAFVAGGLVVGLALAALSARGEEFAYYHENVLGTALELVVNADSELQAQAAEQRALHEIDRLAAIFSNHDPASEFRRFQAARGSTKISLELMEVLSACEHFMSLGRGAFDPRVEVVSRLWKRAAERNALPAEDEIARALDQLAAPAWRLDPRTRTALRLGASPLSLDGIAKGYIAHRACAAAIGDGREARGALVNLGGDLRVQGALEPTVAIVAPWADSESAEPLTRVRLKDCSVATSGGSQRGFPVAGHWYSHVIDPRTGRPVERRLEATVIAPRGLDADALAKVMSVLEPEESLAIARALPGVEFLVVTGDRRLIRTAGFARLEQAAGQARREPEPAASKAAEDWQGFELEVGYEINQPAAGGRYRRPYVVVWVEDAQGKSVRTLILWVSQGGPGPFRWLPDLKRWYKGDQARKKNKQKDLFFTIARPTRPAGKYKVVWDGKDDTGRLLPRGEYTISIEAAREHGTYQCIRRTVTLADKPFSEVLKGNVEIKSASLEYRRRDPGK